MEIENWKTGVKHCLSEAQNPSLSKLQLYEFEFKVTNLNLDSLGLVSIWIQTGTIQAPLPVQRAATI